MSLLKTHLSEEILSDLAEGKVEKESLADVRNHLSSCGKCSAEAEKFTKIIGLMKSDDSHDAPKDSMIWAKNLFKTRAAAPKKSIIQKILAVLEVDLSQNQPVFGERSAASPVNQLFFRADDIGISLRISKDGGEASVMGQILGGEFGNSEISLKNDENSFVVSANEMSEFRLPKVPQGIYDLMIRNPEKEILIEKIDLG